MLQRPGAITNPSTAHKPITRVNCLSAVETQDQNSARDAGCPVPVLGCWLAVLVLGCWLAVPVLGRWLAVPVFPPAVSSDGFIVTRYGRDRKLDSAQQFLSQSIKFFQSEILYQLAGGAVRWRRVRLLEGSQESVNMVRTPEHQEVTVYQPHQPGS